MIKKFSASLDELYHMLSFIHQYAEGIGFEFSDISKIELASEEALVNIVSYGYPHRNGYIEIQCHLHEGEGLCIIIRDEGVPYNPVANAKKFNPNSPLEERTVGGYGVYFILKVMDEVNYSRERNSNVLTLIKHR